jgi:hypothetical protein
MLVLSTFSSRRCFNPFRYSSPLSVTCVPLRFNLHGSMLASPASVTLVPPRFKEQSLCPVRRSMPASVTAVPSRFKLTSPKHWRCFTPESVILVLHSDSLPSRFFNAASSSNPASVIFVDLRTRSSIWGQESDYFAQIGVRNGAVLGLELNKTDILKEDVREQPVQCFRRIGKACFLMRVSSQFLDQRNPLTLPLGLSHPDCNPTAWEGKRKNQESQRANGELKAKTKPQ